MQKSLLVLVGAVFGIALVATCGGKMAGMGDAGAQSGPTRMLTADTDINQLATGMLLIPESTGMKIQDGPFVLTDARAGTGMALYALPSGQDCNSVQDVSTLNGTNGRLVVDINSSIGAVSGRFLINAAEQLCANWAGSGNPPAALVGKGFHPY